MKLLNKKNIFILAVTLVTLSFIAQYVLKNTCPSNVIGDSCGEIFFILREVSYLFAFVLMPVIFSLPFNPRVFDAWKMFALPAIPVVLILAYLISQMRDGGGVGVVGFHPGLVLFPLLYGAYFLISLAIIIVAAIRERKKIQ